jgi:hydroxylaminobenzene mutase
MQLNDSALRLCRHGALLFLLGLVNGGVVSMLTNSRMGLSAHLAGVQNGMVLLIFGMVWQHLNLSARATRVAELSSIFSMYAIWVALLLAAAFGTSRVTPIAGAGFEGSAWQEGLVAVLIYTGSVGILVAAGLVFWGLRSKAPGASDTQSGAATR